MTMQLDINTLKSDVSYIKDKLDEVSCKLESKYVSKDEFNVVRNLVFGTCSIILTAFIGGLVFIIFK